MAVRDNLVLKGYDTTTRQKAFVVQYGTGTNQKTATYFGNVEKYDDVFDKSVNANRFCLSSASSVIFHNVYDSSRILFHGLAARRHRYQYTTKDDYQHIYRAVADETLSTSLSNGLCSLTKAQDTLYGIDSQSTYGHYYVNDDIYSWLAQDNGYPLPKPMKYTTLLYDKNHLSASNTPKVVDSLISGITYNTLFEIPGNLYTDYSSGSMFATTVKCKNHLNAVYSMSHSGSNILKNTRCYNGISSCNNQVYLSFQDTGSFATSTTNNVKISVDIPNEQQHVIMHRFATPTNSVASTASVEQIELIQNINRGATPSNHKSSLYSLNLTAPDLEKITTTTSKLPAIQVNQIKENIRQEVKNVIRSLAERIAPANAQLFDVKVNNK